MTTLQTRQDARTRPPTINVAECQRPARGVAYAVVLALLCWPVLVGVGWLLYYLSEIA